MESRALLGEATDGRVALQVGAGYLVAEIEHHLGDAVHSGAADTDKVQVTDAPHGGGRQTALRCFTLVHRLAIS
jgi:hypothetical protein